MPDRHGPLRNTRFLLEIDGVARGGFSVCCLPSARTDVVEYREGNDGRPTNRKLAGSTDYGPLVLKGGVADGTGLYEWHRLVEQGKLGEARRPVAVVVLDEEGQPGARWEFRDAWPARYGAPRLDATGKGVALETLEIVTEGFERVQ
ncbi:phage tail protein [Haloplanus sp. GCM10025708]|uniref:phage tail protein n=1 Tax=Haloferacaceae TaxID=1644056 RepID=UPI0036063FF8